MKISDYLDSLSARGKCTFTIADAQKAIQKSRKSTVAAIDRLKRRHEIASPAKGFYLIVPPEYRQYQSIPAEQFIPYLLKFWGLDYYVGVLTAAMYHGASHQKPQVFQVITTKALRSIRCGKVKVVFVVKKKINHLPIQTVSTPKSILRVSTPEVTAMDLLLYPDKSGGINNIATVLTELQEAMKADALKAVLESNLEVSWKQRLGYLLMQVGDKKLYPVIEKHLKKQKRVDYTFLVPDSQKSRKKYSKDAMWKIIKNICVESDL